LNRLVALQNWAWPGPHGRGPNKLGARSETLMPACRADHIAESSQQSTISFISKRKRKKKEKLVKAPAGRVPGARGYEHGRRRRGDGDAPLAALASNWLGRPESFRRIPSAPEQAAARNTAVRRPLGAGSLAVSVQGAPAAPPRRQLWRIWEYWS
jgi:hypothetical protein